MKKRIKNIIDNIEHVSFKGDSQIIVDELVFDSKKASSGSLFFAIKGTKNDGHDFIQNAYDNGCRAFVVEKQIKIDGDYSCVLTKNTSRALAVSASFFYDNPSEKLKLIGVTGTNGKTTTATLLYELFTSIGHCSGLISTVINKVGREIDSATHNTPDPIKINSLLLKMVQKGCSYVFMEVSSHAIHQNRIYGLSFSGAMFTNITHDHLDYHKTFSEYLKVKSQLFNQLKTTAFALTNIDDKNGEIVVQNTKAKIFSYALKRPADFKVKIIENELCGLNLQVNGKEFLTRLIGRFNAYNIVAVYGCALLLGQEEIEVLCALSNLKSAEGRFDHFQSKGGVTAIIDYAHTPDALKNVLETISSIKKKNSNVITVVGCGGDRDQEKRPKMAKIAFSKSNFTFLTSDNPRSEDPQFIIDQMLNGISVDDQEHVFAILDRKQAIKMALSFAKQGDIVLIAGKGHEKYQEIKGVRHPFDDVELTKQYLINK